MRAMAGSGRIRRRLALAIVLTALIPVLVAIWLVEKTLREASAAFFVPEFGTHLEQSLELYQDLAREVKASMRHEAAALAADQTLRSAAAAGDRARTRAALEQQLHAHPRLVELSVRRGEEVLSSVSRGRPLDPEKENQLEVVRPLSGSSGPVGDSDEDEDSPNVELVTVFAADKARFEQLGEMSQFVNDYHQLERMRDEFGRRYLLAMGVLLGLLIVASVGVGSLLARNVTRRLAAIGRATQRVAEGDLTTRVPADGSDELTDLARAFNRMVGEVETSRARIEYLQRISAWQEMARRLAHEIKNPLTPIQLAVQEIHRRYGGQEAEYRRLLDTTLEVVEDEVMTLRRLVGEFSDFARLPHAELERADLAAFLRELSEQPLLADEDHGDGAPLEGAAPPRIDFELPSEAAPVMMDRQMLRRVMINLLRNASQALGPKLGGAGRILVRLERKKQDYELSVEDNGPGIPAELRESIFDPYVTTKTFGTGLGLAIAKKIVIEHGGTISATESPLGGARIGIRLPRPAPSPAPAVRSSGALA